MFRRRLIATRRFPRRAGATFGRQVTGDGTAIVTCGLPVTGSAPAPAMSTGRPSGCSTTDAGITSPLAGTGTATALPMPRIARPTAAARAGIGTTTAFPTPTTAPRAVGQGIATATVYRIATTTVRTIPTIDSACDE